MSVVPPGGKHIIVDYYGVPAEKLINCTEIEELFNKAAIEAKATPIGGYFHHFGEGCGVTGILALAESHMSIHTWPEDGYCAIDIFMCGNSKPKKALEMLDTYFVCSYSKVRKVKRG